MRPVSARRALRRVGTCVAAAVGLFSAGFATPAFADEPQTDRLWINVPYEQALPLGTDGGDPESRSLGLGLSHDNDTFTVTDGKVTVDVSGLAGVAEVTWPENCAPSGTSAVCDVPEVPVTGPDYHHQIHLTLRAADGAAAGASGRITYEASATGGPAHRASRQLRHHGHGRLRPGPGDRRHPPDRHRRARCRRHGPLPADQQGQRERGRLHGAADGLLRPGGADRVRRVHIHPVQR
ncbi:hypothetical protein ACFW9V_41385 [Streptomyces hygroscopicus]|uniref:hypothetical protein n=1 Tax=Streptomyces hygroscopicus TaxID=1912 RepID=UPI0036AD57E8